MEIRRGPGRYKCKFTNEEDTRLADAVRLCGRGNWELVASALPGRNPRQCRERWANYINPVLDQSPLRPDEEHLLDDKVAEHGRRWQFIVSFFPRRGRNTIKNNWLMRHSRPAATQSPNSPKKQKQNSLVGATESVFEDARTDQGQEEDEDLWDFFAQMIL
jgi:hypothetical protein